MRGAIGTPASLQRVGDAMGEQRLHTGPAGEDLEGGDAARGGVAIARRADVGAHLGDHPLPTTHGEKKGRDT